MKNILILLLSIISVAGYGQTILNPLGSNTVSNINDANTKPTAVAGTDTYTATLPGSGYATGSAFFTYITDRVITFKFANAATSGPYSLSLNSEAAKTLKKKNSSGTVVDIVSTDIPAANTILPLRYNGTYFVIESGGSGGISGLTVGTTTITSGTTTKVLYDNAGALGEYTVSGSGNVAMTTSPVFTTPNIGSATGSISGNAATVTTNANLTGDVTSTGNATAIASGVIVNADVNASAAIAGSKLDMSSATGIPLATAVTGTLPAVSNLPQDEYVTDATTTRTLTSGDRDKVIRFTSSSSITVTLPNSIASGFSCVIVKAGTGDITLSAATTLEGATTITGTAPSFAVVKNRGSDIWVTNGSYAAAASIGTFDAQTVSSNGGTLTNGVLYFQSADLTHPGQVNNTTQTFAGNKTFDGNVILKSVGQHLSIKEGTNGWLGRATLVSGTIAITVSGVTSSTECFITRRTPSGTSLTVNYDCICSSNTVTIQADVAAGTINTADGSTFSYHLIDPAP